MATKTKGVNGRVLTLKDRLSRLTFTGACRLLGEDGRQLIRAGGGVEIDFEQDVDLDAQRFRMRVNGAVVTIAHAPEVKQHMRWNCTQCDAVCEHVGAAMSLILEEKMALGLAAPPRERVPVESLGEEQLLERAVADRRERAGSEKMIVRAIEPNRLWSDYSVTNPASGRTYRVALRGWEPGESYCTCPDFRKNTLGLCKHIINVQTKAKRRFPASKRNRGHRQRGLAVHLRYGVTLELRLLIPADLDLDIEKLVRPLRDKPIEDVRDLLKRVARIEALGTKVTIYPDAEEFIDRRLLLDRIEATVREIRKNPEAHVLRKTLLDAELLPYQLDGIAFAVGAGRAILADDMGLGKTIQGIGVAELLAHEADISKVLVICPASIKAQWRSEIERFSKRDVQLVLGGAAERVSQYDNDCFFTICNYEQVLRDIVAIERVPWDLIILDEGQRIKNWEAKTSQVVKGLRSPFVLVLTGTPIENRLDDLFSVVEFIDDRRLGPAFRFFNRHRLVDERGKVLGYQRLGELRERLKPILLRRTRSSIMKDLPERTTEIVRIAPTAEQLTIHDGQRRIIRSIVNKRFISEMDLLRLRKALLICRMVADSTFLVDKEPPGFSSKLEALDNLLGSLFAEDGRKVLLFSEWTTMLTLIEPLIEKYDAPFVRLDGSVPQAKRQQIVRTFQKDPACRLFLSTNAGSVGLNLQAADTVINVDLPWNPAILEQRIARAHRMGQKRPVHVFLLVTEDTIEENLLGTLSAKQELAMAALDVESDVDRVDLSTGVEELRRRLELLLGAKPAAPVVQREATRVTEEAQRLARGEGMVAAGGQLLAAGLSFLDQLIPPRQGGGASPELVDTVKRRLDEFIERDETGRPTLRLTLPDSAVLDRLAGTLARLLEIRAK